MLSNTLIRLCFTEIGRSLFKADRLTYSMHFIKGVFPQLFQKNEWEFFNGLAIAEASTNSRLPKWAS
jgi:dynein heavy chain 2